MIAWKVYDIKSVNAQQGKSVYNFNNIRKKLLRLMQMLGTQKFSRHNQLARK